MHTAREHGFSLVEVLVALGLTLVIGASGISILRRLIDASLSQPEAVDMQERARLGAERLMRALYVAGAGPEGGPAYGPLNQHVPPIVPRRIGAVGAAAPTVAVNDVLSVMWVPETPLQLTLAAPLAATSVTVGGTGVCPAPGVSCSIADGVGLVAFDDSGHYDLFTAEVFRGTTGSVRWRTGPGQSYPIGTPFVEIETRTFYFNRPRRQLRQYDGDFSDVPVLDDVVDFRVEYLGTGEPPVAPRPPIGIANCLYDAAGSLQGGTPGAGSGGDVVPLPLSRFTDGPWCGDGSTMFDADLLRIRQVRISIRVQAASSFLRARSADYAIPGTTASAWRAVPDYSVAFVVSPRNMQLQ